MSKICTSIKQSQKLIELGINVNTADMDYIPFANDPKNYDCVINIYNNEHEDNWIPAWSLSALLELIPDIIEDYVLRIDKVYGEYYIWYGEGWSDNMAHTSSENFIDAAFEMVVWLKENNKI